MKILLDRIISLIGGSKGVLRITRSSDVLLATLLVSIVGMIIIGLPVFLLDTMLAINLSFSVALLLIAIYVPSAVHLSTFPSLLLVTTLFRLGLNICSTRLILLDGNAGKIVKTFGDFVVQGNLVVGAIVFLIITIVQFMVITKGAERVAEVAARFTLDAMPGKQMSIDADMRAGMIDADEARKRRLAIQKESQLFGAMDGAMKFVKGDAIAGLIITAINIIGGLIIGMTMKNLSAVDAAKKYSILSIGDGLVSQMPALLISITAGFVTTRVGGDEKENNLGGELSGQLLKQPKALMMSGIVMLFLCFVPGFPWYAFFPLGIVAIIVGYILSQDSTKSSHAMSQGSSSSTISVGKEEDGHSVVTGGGIDSYMLTVPTILEVGSFITQEIQRTEKNKNFIDYMIPRMRQALYHDLGVRFPGVHIRVDSPNVAEDEYLVHLNEVPIIKGKVLPHHILTNEVQENLQRYQIPFIAYKNALQLPSLWVEEKHADLLKQVGMKSWNILEVLMLHLSYFYRHYSNEFLGIQEMKGIITFMEKSFPDLIKEVTRLIPLQKMTEIFRRLIQEEISIKDLRTIFEALAEWAQSEKDTVLLTEYVRSSLKRYISYKYSQGESNLSVYLLDPEIEDVIRGAIKQTSAGSYLALDPDSVQQILQAIRNTVTPPPPTAQPSVILTAIDVRRFTKKLIESEFPDISVLSYQEIIPEIHIQPLGRIQF